ncbi:Vacuolar protein sorting-associated protein 13A [Babesia sp. Xinjiang]|uniref:Vacuolar protein sorting-associated protein 13A n=1 Tax=Babesia sp. Xinjiang TaxID=462227 RepID=UPI000A25D8C9|nr:Vacuolar protein sorting-associated protein 13A [Babesia sp. Xinjiang]ORM42281.1 Vacuolar protein sorting-associated protein 13A [Babesia sp. Xinjiang]
MFEGKIINLLNKLLKPYVDGIDENTLHLSNLLSGKVVLTGLRLKPSIVHSLGLPYHMTFGLIDHVSITIHLPLLSLSKRKLVVEINQVIMLLTAIPENQWDPAAFREEHVAYKVATLAAESLQQVVTEIEGGGIIWRTVVSFLENLEVRINNIHIRIEDFTTNPNLAYAFGCMVKSAVFLTGLDPASSTNDGMNNATPFRRSFYNDHGALNPSVIHRRIELREVGVYVDRLDPIRPGMMHNTDFSRCNSYDKDNARMRENDNFRMSSTDSLDEALFVDARSHGSAASAAYARYGNPKAIHFVRIARRHRLRYCPATKNKPCRKEFRIKCRRAGDNGRHRLRFVRFAYDPAMRHPSGPPRRLKVLASTNAIFGRVVSRVMAYLSSGDHVSECEGGARTGWQRSFCRGNRNYRHQRTSLSTSMGCRLSGIYCDRGDMGKKDSSTPSRGFRRMMPHVNMHNGTDRHCASTHGSITAGPSSTGTCRMCNNDGICCFMCPVFCDDSSVCDSTTPENNLSFENSIGCNLSSASTWRILLSTFCDIKQPEEEHEHESFDIIHKAQERYASRHHGRSCGCTKHEPNLKKANSDVNFVTTVEESNMEVDSVSVSDVAPTHNSDDVVIEGDEQSEVVDSARCFGVCNNIDCVLSEAESDPFDPAEYNAEKNAPLSYDETWHTQGIHGGTFSNTDTKVEADTPDVEPNMEKCADSWCHQDAKTVGETWTRFTFVVKRNGDSGLKELFLRLLEESNHNYIVNPKEFNGVASFYLCLYPTRPSVKPRTCWSRWGLEQDSKLYKEDIAMAKEYLPKWSIFLHLEGLNLVISKDQLECLTNILYEGIMKYFSWQCGIIYTFENPRPTPEDENMYMEYWPQYLLLGQSSQKNELREFIMDFEILHSIPAIRVLRKNSSTALRNLIQSFGERRGYSCDARDCLTDVLLTNICGQYEREGSEPDDDREESSRLHARLKIVGGIYEIATKHAKSHAFLDSLRKICQPQMLTFDFAFDLVLKESRVTYTYEVEPYDSCSLAAKAYVFSTKGLHVFFCDMYGRDGCQVVVTELLPFSLVSFPFSIENENVEYHSLHDCPCRFLDAPATVLISCGDVSSLSTHTHVVDTEPANMTGLKKLHHDFAADFLGRSDETVRLTLDANMYIGMGFNRYCTPNDADTRFLFHVNCDVFGHMHVLDELGDHLRMKKHNQRENDTVNPVLVGAHKRILQLSQDRTGCYTELYELIDLGIEFSRNLLQGPISFMNRYFFVEVRKQMTFFVDAGFSDYRMPYAVCLESFAVASDVTPRVVEPQGESPYDSHLLRLSNMRLISVNGDYSFLTDGGNRQIYLGSGCLVKLSDYLGMTCSLSRRRGCDDPVIALSLSKLQNNFEILSMGRDNEVFIKFKCANSVSTKRDVPRTIITANLGSIYVSLREYDLLHIIDIYTDYVRICNDYEAFIRSYGARPTQVINESGNKPGHMYRKQCEATGVNSTNMPNRCCLMDFRTLVSHKWHDLQHTLKQRALEASQSTLYEVKLDYLFSELRRPVRLDNGQKYQYKPTDIGVTKFDDSLPGTPCPTSTTSMHYYDKDTDRHDANDMGSMVIIPTVDAGSYATRGEMVLSDIRRNTRLDYLSSTEFGHTASRHAALCNMQSVLSRYGVALPLASCKVTGIGIKACYSDHGTHRLRAFVGCVEVEDQTNAVPIYLSTMFRGGNTTLFWRWLKVTREVQRVRSSLESYSDGMNKVMRHLLSEEGDRGHCGRLDTRDQFLRDRLRHIEYSSIRFNHRLSHEYQEEEFFQLKSRNSFIARAYQRAERYIASVMEYAWPTDINVQPTRENLHLDLPCMMTASLDYDDCSRGRCTVNFSNLMVNFAWEVADEFIGLFTRVVDRLAQIPSSMGTNDEPCTEVLNVDATINVAQSSLHVLCDSSWVGYKNFVDYMWFKLLRDSYNLVDPGSAACSRACSIADAGEARNALYFGMNERSSSQRGLMSQAGSQNTATQSTGDSPALSVKAVVEKRREHAFRTTSKERISIHDKGTHMGIGNNFNPNLKWSFVSLLLHETYRKAFLSTPIYMHGSGRGTIFISLRTDRADTHVPQEHVTNDKGMPYLHEVSRRQRGRILSGYPPLGLYMRACGSNISASFSRQFSYHVLTPCGFVLPHHRRSVPVTEEYKRQQYDFMKYIWPQRKRDNKLLGLFESSKNTLYDFNEPVDSHFIQPFRVELSATLLLNEPSFMGRITLPQSLCITVMLQSVKASLSCIDVLSFCSIIGLLAGCLDMDSAVERCGSEVYDIPSAQSSITVQPTEHLSPHVDFVERRSSGVEEFFSCAQSASESDWVSVVSSNNGDDIDISCFQERKYGLLKKSIRRRTSIVRAGFLEQLLSELSVGLKLSFDLLYIEISSNHVNELKNMVTITVEDFGSYFWSNGSVSFLQSDYISSFCGSDNPLVTDTTRECPSNESLSLSDVYSSGIDNKISLCYAGVHRMLYRCYTNDERHSCILRANSPISTDGVRGNLPFDSATIFDSAQPLLRFESHMCVTVDICRDMRREMVVEPVTVCFRGSKQSLYTKTLANLSTSWINVNISLNGAHCLFNFLKYISEMARIRMNLVEDSETDYKALQPAVACKIDTDVTRTMIPAHVLKGSFQLNHTDNPSTLGLINHKLPIWEIPAAIEYRLRNNLLHRLRYLDVHASIMDSLRALSLLKLEGDSERASFHMGEDISQFNATGNTDATVNTDNGSESQSYLVNNLGQPIALCLYANSTFEQAENQEWRVIDDGGRCELPLGNYGIILPFVVRIQLNNCIYEIPSSMLNLTQEDEMMFRLDVSRNYQRGRNVNRMAFLRTIRHDRMMAKMYRFGVSMGCTRFIVSDFVSSSNRESARSLQRHNTIKGWRDSMVRNFRKIGQTSGMPLHLFEHEEFKYAYLMVRTQQRVGGKVAAGTSAASHLTIQLSSALWISNNTREKLVVFPSVSVDSENRMIPISSLVWLSHHAPLTSAFPLSLKTVACNKAIDVVKSVGNNLFKQLTSMQESKHQVKHITPAHVLNPTKLNDDVASGNHEFRLQHIALGDMSYKNQRISVPLSWTIEPECTICVCLQEDFPFDVDSEDTTVHVTRGDNMPFNFLSDTRAYFTGDVLLSSVSAKHLYASLEQPRIKTPIPDYVARVNLGHIDPEDILASGLNTGFVQDITVTRKARDTFRTRSLSSNQIVKRASEPTIENASGDEVDESIRMGSLSSNNADSDGSKSDRHCALIDMHSSEELTASNRPADDYSATSQSDTDARCPELPLDSLNNELGNSASTASIGIYGLPVAYVLKSQRFARLSIVNDGKSVSPTTIMVLRRRNRIEHMSSSRLDHSQDITPKCKFSLDSPGSTDRLPKSILSSTLVEVTSSSRLTFGTKLGRSGIRHYEIALESCHIIENMMPFDVYILSPATFDYLNRPKGSENANIDDVPLYPMRIKACNRWQFSWYMKHGRFVLKELLSREFNLKPPTDTVDISSLVFDAMQPKFFETLSGILDTNVDPHDHGTTYNPTGKLPRRLVVSVEVSRKPMEPLNEQGAVVKRYLASTQYIYTLFVDKWIVNWLNYPISLCRGDGRYKQTIPAQNCTLVSQDLSSTSLQLAIRKTTMRHIPNFESYPKRTKRRRLFSFDRSSDTHVMSSTFSMPDLAFSTCDFSDTVECPKLHYLISTSMAPAPFFRTSILEILPQTTVTNDFTHPLWLREPDGYATGSGDSSKYGAGWYIVEPGSTVELHSQAKGELVVEVTGIDPGSFSGLEVPKQYSEMPPTFQIWSSGVVLKPSNLIQFRYPASINTQANSAHTTTSKPQPTQLSLSRTLKYGLCEVEIRMHRGAKVVRFMKPSVADWMVLNTTGIDLWVEQQGVPGYGEVVPTVGASSGVLSERYAGMGVPFACYDPGKEQKLICRFHLGPRAFKLLINQLSKGGRRKNESFIGNVRNDFSDGLLSAFPLKHVLHRHAGRVVRVKGSLRVNLSRVESMRCSSVIQLRYGSTVISMRLTAQTCVAFGQKTLHFTAVLIPTRGFLRFNRIHPMQLLHIYSALRDKLTVPHDMSYNRLMTHRRIRHIAAGVRRLIPSTLCAKSGSPFMSLRYFNVLRCLRNVIGREEQKSFETLPRPGSKSRVSRSRFGNLFNWDYVFQVNFLGLGTAICGDITEELVYISSTLVKFRLCLDNDEHLFSLSVGWIQSDVHDSTTCYATMLRPLASWQSSTHTYDLRRRVHNRALQGVGHDVGVEGPQSERRVISITFNTRGNENFSVREITNCRIELEPLSLNLDTRIGQSLLMLVDEFISIFGFSNATADYFTTANVGIFSNVDSWLRSFDVAQYPLEEVAQSQFNKSLSGGTRYNISNLHVGRIALAINIRRSGSRFSSDLQAQNVLIRHLMHIVRRTPHISDANIILAQESLLELCCTPYALLSHFVIRYVTQSVQQIYKVLGAVDLIGNPKIVLHHWINGVCQAASIMRESLQYLHIPPVAIFLWFRSVSRVGVSAISGIADALYRFTGSWYLLFNTLALNSDRYAVLLMQDTFGKTVDQPSNVMDGIVFGGQSIGRNLYVSVGNFALKPIHQLLRFLGSVKTARGVNGEVLLSGLHIVGSMVSSLASLSFGTVSSLLSGISVLSQGLLHQIHSVPMLSAIRPQRSVNLLNSSGPMRYNFLESWSMCASRRIAGLNELLVLLPLDGKLKMFDPMHAAMSHWSALSPHMAMISPIAVCTPSSDLQTYLWVNRTHVGLIHRRKLLWSCESKCIRSIEIIRVPAMSYQSSDIMRYDDSIPFETSIKAVRKYFSNDTFYLRLVHVTSESSPQLRGGPAAIPPSLLSRLKDEKTFPCKEGSLLRLYGAFQQQESTKSIREEGGRSYDEPGTPVQRYYQTSLAGITIDKYERTADGDMVDSAFVKSPSVSSNSSSSRTQTTVSNENDTARSYSVESATGHRSAGGTIRTRMAAEVVRLPSMETAQLYFTLMISVLRASAL